MSPPQSQCIQGLGGSLIIPGAVPSPQSGQVPAPLGMMSTPFPGSDNGVLQMPKIGMGIQQDAEAQNMASFLPNLPQSSAPLAVFAQPQLQQNQAPPQTQQQHHLQPQRGVVPLPPSSSAVTCPVSSPQVVYVTTQAGQSQSQAQQGMQIPASLLNAAANQSPQPSHQQQIPIQTITLPNGQQLHIIPHHLVQTDMKPVNTSPQPAVNMQSAQPQQAHQMTSLHPTSTNAALASPDNAGSLRAQQLARYRQKRNNRIRAITEGQKKIRYQCRKTLADARPRVKGRFAKVHTDSNPTSPKATSSTSKKGGRLAALKENCRIQTVMSAVDLTALKHAALAEENDPKVEELGDMDDFNPMWWLNEGSASAEAGGAVGNTLAPAANSLLDDIVNGDMRRCYSETNLMQFESADVQAALEVLQTEQNFNNICMGLQQP